MMCIVRHMNVDPFIARSEWRHHVSSYDLHMFVAAKEDLSNIFVPVGQMHWLAEATQLG